MHCNGSHAVGRDLPRPPKEQVLKEQVLKEKEQAYRAAELPAAISTARFPDHETIISRERRARPVSNAIPAV